MLFVYYRFRGISPNNRDVEAEQIEMSVQGSNFPLNSVPENSLWNNFSAEVWLCEFGRGCVYR